MNKHRGDCLIHIDGKDWNFRFTINDLAELEDILGHPLVKADWDSIVQVRKIVQYMLHKQNDKVTIPRAGVMIDNTIENGMRFPELAAKVASAVFACLAGPIVDESEVTADESGELDLTGTDGSGSDTD